jgi:hypothetical protein
MSVRSKGTPRKRALVNPPGPQLRPLPSKPYFLVSGLTVCPAGLGRDVDGRAPK